jgi:two-component system sensor histidine kinase VicK
VKYTQPDGHIVAEIGTHEGSLYIRVTDNGYGIPKTQHAKIFEKLFRADNVRQKDTEGTGLGMYIVKAIVESSGGKIWFDSEENKGTTFSVLLPLSGMVKKSGFKGLS